MLLGLGICFPFWPGTRRDLQKWVREIQAKRLKRQRREKSQVIDMELEELLREDDEKTTPNIQEIERALCEIISRFGYAERATAVVNKLWQKYAVSAHHAAQKPQSFPIPAATSKESIKVTSQGQFQFSQHELSHIFQFQKRVAAQKFIRAGYGLDLFREEIEKIGLFEIVEKRYKVMSKEIVIQAYRTLEDFLQKHCGVTVSPLSKLEEVCLQAILLNCRYLFERREIMAFMKFVALIFEDGCSSIVMNSQDALSFYQTANGLLMSKLEEGRKVFKLRYESRLQKPTNIMQQVFDKMPTRP